MARLMSGMVSTPIGVSNPWMLVAQLSLLLLVIFVVDATITVWRRGNRRQALIVGGSIVLLVVLSSAQAVAMSLVRPLREIRIYSPTSAKRERLAAELKEQLGIDVSAVDEPRIAVRGAQVLDHRVERF